MKQEITEAQHKLLKKLMDAGAAVAVGKLNTRPAVTAELVAGGWVAEQKQGRSKLLILTDAGREHILRHPTFVKVRPQFGTRPHLFLLELMLMGGNAASADFSAAPTANDRKPLADAKLLDVSKGPKRSVLYALTDAGWKWAEDHLEDSYQTPGPAAKVLQKALAKLREYLQANELRLADFVRAKSRHPVSHSSESSGDAAPESGAIPNPLPDQSAGIEAAIQAVCLALGDGLDRRRLRLADVRRRLPEFDRAAQDQALLKLERAGTLALYGMDDPKEMVPDDRAAEFKTPGGEPRHLLYWIGSDAAGNK